MMSEINLGNNINQIVNTARNSLFLQGELAQLTYSAFDSAATTIRSNENEEIEISFPVGYPASGRPILSNHKYKKEELIERYRFLADSQLAINAIYQLVMTIEAMLSDVIRAVVMKYPKKIGTKKSISTRIVLTASSVEEIHLHAVNSIINELSYKTAKDFAATLRNIVSVNLLECPAFHKYIELKATRDIYIHNRGTANEIYIAKAGSHARVKAGVFVPVNALYFLESYESCLQLTEWLETNLHEVWPSSEYEDRKAASNSNMADKTQQIASGDLDAPDPQS